MNHEDIRSISRQQREPKLVNKFYLRIDSDTLEQAKGYTSKRAAVAAFAEVARELARYGQACAASIHVAPSRATTVEYPDFVLSLGERNGVVVEAA